MPPVQLHAFAPCMKRFVAWFPVGLSESFTRLAIGVADAFDDMLEFDTGEGFAGEELLRLRQTQQCLPPTIRAGAPVEAVAAVLDECPEPFCDTGRHDIEADF